MSEKQLSDADDWWNADPAYTEYQRGRFSRSLPPYGEGADISGRSAEWQRGWLELDEQFKASRARIDAISQEMRALYLDGKQKLEARIHALESGGVRKRWWRRS